MFMANNYCIPICSRVDRFSDGTCDKNDDVNLETVQRMLALTLGGLLVALAAVYVCVFSVVRDVDEMSAFLAADLHRLARHTDQLSEEMRHLAQGQQGHARTRRAVYSSLKEAHEKYYKPRRRRPHARGGERSVPTYSKNVFKN